MATADDVIKLMTHAKTSLPSFAFNADLKRITLTFYHERVRQEIHIEMTGNLSVTAAAQRLFQEYIRFSEMGPEGVAATIGHVGVSLRGTDQAGVVNLVVRKYINPGQAGPEVDGE